MDRYKNKSALQNEGAFEKIKQSIGLRVKNLRAEKNMTQEDLAHILAISRNHLALVETGRNAPSLKLAYQLSLSLDCSMDYLLGLSPIRETMDLPTTDIYELIDQSNVSFGQRHIADDEKDRVKDFIKDCLFLMDKYS